MMQMIIAIAKKIKNKLVILLQKKAVKAKIQYYKKNITNHLEVVTSQKKNILFFLPEAGVKPHFITATIIAKTLQQRGNNVVFISCFDFFDRCPTRSMYRISPNATEIEKQTICVSCKGMQEDYLTRYQLPTIDIRNFVSFQKKQEIKLLIENAPDRLLEFEYDGILFGKLASYEMVLNTKISDFNNIKVEHRKIWLQLIQTAIISYMAVEEIQKKYNFDVFLSNNSYAGALGTTPIAKKYGVKYMFCTEAAYINADRSKILITEKMFWETVIFWKEWYNLALLPQQINHIYKDLLNHFLGIGSHQYSPSSVIGDNRSLLEKLNIPKNKKILIAYNSSEDEILGYNHLASVMGWEQMDETANAFENQLEWLKEISEFAENSNDYHLIIRLHPRLGKNKRENKVSTHYEELKEILDKPTGQRFKNVTIIWPEEQISSYSLLDFADLVLVSWSSVSIDVGRLGIPVLSYTKRIPTFPLENIDNSFITIASEKKSYFEAIQNLVNRERNIGHIISAMRWYNMRHLATAIDIDDVLVHSPEDLPTFVLPRENELIEKAILGDDAIIKESLKRQQNVQSLGIEDDEKVAIQKMLRRFIHYSITGEVLKNDKEIEIYCIDKNSEVLPTILPNPFQALMVYNQNEIEYIYVDKTYKYHSLLCVELSKLCRSN